MRLRLLVRAKDHTPQYRRQPDARCSRLAEAEKSHYNLLKTMHSILDKGSVFINLGRFGGEALEAMIGSVDEAIKKADEDSFERSDAVAVALKIETSLIDSHFYDVVSTDAPEFKIIAGRLSSEIKKHVDLISRVAEMYGKDAGTKEWVG